MKKGDGPCHQETLSLVEQTDMCINKFQCSVMSAIIRWNYLRFNKMVKEESIGLLLGCVGRGFTEKVAFQ